MWPADADLGLHLLGALLIMGVGNVGLLVTAPALGRGPLSTLRRLRIPTLIIGAVMLAAAILHTSRTYLGLGMGGMERVAAFPLHIWLVIMAIAILRGLSRPMSG